MLVFKISSISYILTLILVTWKQIKLNADDLNFAYIFFSTEVSHTLIFFWPWIFVNGFKTTGFMILQALDYRMMMGIIMLLNIIGERNLCHC